MTRHGVVALFAVALLGGCGADPAAPTATFDRTSHDFGVVRQRQDLHATFRLTNTGGAPLRVKSVDGNCGCLTGRAKDPVVAPGATTELVATFHTHAMAGPQAKWLRVETDDPKTPKVAFTIACDVSAGVVVDPSHFYFPLALVGTSPAPKVLLRWREGVGTPFRVLGVEGSGVDADFVVEPWAKDVWRGYEVTARFRAPPPVGTVSGRAVIRTDSPEAPAVEALVGGVVSGRVWITQRSTSLGTVESGRAAKVTVFVRPFDATIDLGEVRATAERGRVRAAATRAPGTPGAWNVEISVPAGAPPGDLADRVRVTTAVPGEEQHWIDVAGRVVPARR